MKRHPVPGTEHWFELRDLSDLNSDHQDEYNALAIDIRQAKQEAERAALAAAHPGMIPDPDQDIPVRLTPVDTRPLRDLLLSWVLESSSFPLPLTWPMRPLVAWNVLSNALSPYFSALNGVVPPDPTLVASSSTSASTSEVAAAAPQPEQQPEP